jgi:hypothetical protein
MENSSSLRFAGDVSLRQVRLHSLNGQVANVINQVESISVYEDIFSNFITLSIVLRESVDYLNLFPFMGEEYVDIDIVTPGTSKPIIGKFYIYKIEDREYTQEREVVYIIKAISEEFLSDANTKISKAYSGSISESVFKLLGKEGLNTKKKTLVQTTANATKFVAGFWSPIKCINYLSTNAVSQKKSPSYLFYENRDGFNFKAIDDLLLDSTYHTFTKDNYTRTEIDDGGSVGSIKDPNEDYKRVMSLSIPVVSDYMNDIQTGRLKSRMISYDIVTKKYTAKDYSVKKDPLPTTLLNPNPSYSKYATSNSASTMFSMPRYYNNFSNFTDVTNAKTIQKRMSFFQNLNKFRVTVEVIGRTDYTIGQIIELNIPKAGIIVKSDSDTRDLMISGRYLVSAVSHYINRENHMCTLELIKNSTLVDLSKA